MDNQEILNTLHNQLKVQISSIEKALWDLAATDNHSTQDEIDLAKQLMLAERHLQLIDQLEKLFTQDPTHEFAFPMQYALNLVKSDAIAKYFSGFKILDISEEFDKININTITEEQVKGFLILKYEEIRSQSDAWTDQNDFFEIEDAELQEFENEVEQLEDVIIQKEQEEQQQQQQQQQQQIEQESEKQKEEQPIQEELIKEEPKIYEQFDQPKESFKIHDDLICSFAQHPIQKDLIATGSCDDTFKVTKLLTKETIQEQKCADTVSLLSYSFDGKYLAVALVNGTITVHGAVTKILEGSQTEPTLLQWHPKGYAVLAGFEDCTLWLWNGVNGEVISVLAGHEAQVTCGGFTHDGKLILSGSADSTFRIWKPSTSLQQYKLAGHGYHKSEVSCYDQHFEQNLVVTGSTDSTICIINIDNGKAVGRSQEFKTGIVEVCFIKTNQQLLAAGDFGGDIYIYNWNQMKLLDTVSICKGSISRIIFKNNQFYASSLDGKIVQFDHRQLQNLTVTQAQSGIYEMLVEDKLIVVGCENGYIFVY